MVKAWLSPSSFSKWGGAKFHCQKWIWKAGKIEESPNGRVDKKRMQLLTLYTLNYVDICRVSLFGIQLFLMPRGRLQRESASGPKPGSGGSWPFVEVGFFNGQLYCWSTWSNRFRSLKMENLQAKKRQKSMTKSNGIHILDRSWAIHPKAWTWLRDWQ